MNNEALHLWPGPAMPGDKMWRQHDLLDRGVFVDVLCQLISLYQSGPGFVVSLNGHRGTGKSFLAKMLCEQLTELGILSVYVDTCTTGYATDPLATITSKIIRSDSLDAEKRRAFQAAFLRIRPQYTSGQPTPAPPPIAMADQLISTAEGAPSSGEFREALAALAMGDGTAQPMPLVIVVDELDHCPTSYTMEMLRVIQNFFRVPNVFLLLPIHKKQLEQSVIDCYGEIDSAGYLQKFIKYSIKVPTRDDPKHGLTDTEQYIDHLNRDAGNLLSSNTCDFLTKLALMHRCSLRQLELIVVRISIRLALHQGSASLINWLLAYLACAEIVDPQHFNRLQTGTETTDGVDEFLGSPKTQRLVRDEELCELRDLMCYLLDTDADIKRREGPGVGAELIRIGENFIVNPSAREHRKQIIPSHAQVMAKFDIRL